MKNIKNKKPDIRYLDAMRNVLYDKKWAKNAPNIELYYMYRGLKKKGELRYDITIIPPHMLGKEFVKTKGHEHIGNFGEVYIVLEGEAIYLMQKRKKDEIENVYAVKAKKGDFIPIPPGFGHATINPSGKTLKMANWVSEKCRSDYRPIEKRKGACYFAVAKSPKSGKRKIEVQWVKNKNYKNTPKLKWQSPLKEMPISLDFLKGN